MSTPCVVVRLNAERLDAGSLVLKAALSLFSREAEVVLVLQGVEDPTQEQGGAVATLCQSVAAGAAMPDVVLVGESDAVERMPLVSVTATDVPEDVVEAIVLLTSVAMRLWGQLAPATAHDEAKASEFLAQRDAVCAQRDALTPLGVAPRFAVIAQVQSTWGAVEPVVHALREGGFQADVVAVESEHDVQATSTADFLRQRGIEPKSVAWLASEYANPARGLAAVFFYDPWDGLRPQEAGATFAAEHGVRVVYLPYSPNAAAGDKMEQMSYDLPTHRVAWRLYARSDGQKGLFARHCAVGAEHVRVLGTPKVDRVLAAQGADGTANPWRTKALGRPLVLWNPHFSVEPGGWSTFHTNVDVITEYAAQHPDMFLLVRPHFRIWKDLGAAESADRRPLDLLVRMAAEHENIELDRSPDYLEAFSAADAFVSDLSSLITEFFVTRKRILYLRRPDGPDVNEDAAYFLTCDVAADAEGIRDFLDSVRRRPGVEDGRRELALRHYFGREDGHAAERVAADVVAGVLSERASRAVTA